MWVSFLFIICCLFLQSDQTRLIITTYAVIFNKAPRFSLSRGFVLRKAGDGNRKCPPLQKPRKWRTSTLRPLNRTDIVPQIIEFPNFSYSTYYATIFLLPPPILVRKGVFHVEILVSFLLSVMASVVAYYLCKWLDSDE